MGKSGKEDDAFNFVYHDFEVLDIEVDFGARPTVRCQQCLLRGFRGIWKQGPSDWAPWLLDPTLLLRGNLCFFTL